MARFVRMVCVIPGELVGAWEVAKGRAQREGLVLRPTSPQDVHNGQLLECLIASYLAGPEYPDEQWRTEG